MAGHSKWANIKHRKGKADALKGKMFSRVTKEIITAVKEGGSDPKNNPRLRIAIQKAKEVNLPNENIERNIKKAMSTDQAGFVTSMYEIYGHGGVGIIVDIFTDNKNRTAGEVRIAINKCGGNIASPGSVSFNFERKGVIQVLKTQALEEELFLMATEAGAEDFEVTDDLYVIITDPGQVAQVRTALEQKGVKFEETTLEMIPKSSVECNEENFQANMKLVEWLEGLDDVDAVFHNARPTE